MVGLAFLTIANDADKETMEGFWTQNPNTSSGMPATVPHTAMQVVRLAHIDLL